MAASYDGSIRIDTKINTTNAEKGVSKLSSAVQKLGSVIAAVFAVKAIISFASACTDAYETQITYETKLTTALQNRYGATSDLISAVKDLTAEYQSLGVVGDEVQMAGLSALSAYVDDVENLQTLLSGMNDIIAYNYAYDATAEGAESVATAIGRALSTGSTRSLKALGVAIDEATEEALANAATEAEKVEILTEAIANSVGGINEALANTPTGQITQLKNEWGDFKELVGEAATNIEALFVPALRSALSVASSMANTLIELSEALQEVFGYTTSAVVSTATEAAEAEDDLADSAEAANDAIAGNYAGFDEITAMSADSDEDSSSASASTEAEEAESISDKILDTAQSIYDIVTPLLSLSATLWADIKTNGTAIYNSVLKPIFDLLSECLPEVISYCEKIYTNAISPVVTALSGSLLPAVKSVIELAKELINDAIMPLFNWLADKLTPVIQTAANVTGGVLSSVLSSLVEKLKIVVEFITGLVSAFTAGTDAATTFSNVGEVVKQTVEKIAEYAKKAISKLAGVAGSIISTVASYIKENLPEIIEAAEGIISTVIDGIIEYLPMLLEAASGIITALVTYICDNLPDLVEAAVEIITSLVTYICDEIPGILTAVLEILQTLIDFIIENLPMLLDAAIEIILALVDGIIENLPQLITAVTQIIETLVQFVMDNLPEIIEAGIEILLALVDGIIQALPQLISAAIDIILELVTSLCSADNISSLFSTGADILSMIISGIASIISQLPELAMDICSEIWDTIKNTDWLELGKNILTGIGDGIKNAVTSVVDSVKNACSSIWKGVKSFFGISSPSKLMRDTVGNYVAEGIGVGFEDEIGDVTDDMQDALDSEISDIDLSSALKEITAAVPVVGNIDVTGGASSTYIEKFSEMLDVLSDIADNTEDIAEKDDSVTVQITDSSGNVKSTTSTTDAKKQNRIAGKVIIPVEG